MESLVFPTPYLAGIPIQFEQDVSLARGLTGSDSGLKERLPANKEVPAWKQVTVPGLKTGNSPPVYDLPVTVDEIDRIAPDGCDQREAAETAGIPVRESDWPER
jgi:hypothetical protein